MGKRSQASTDLDSLSDASLRVEVERGNEAARALLLSRRLASLSNALSRMSIDSDVTEERRSPDSYYEVHIRLDIIDTLLSDLAGNRPNETARPAPPSLSGLRTHLRQHAQDSGAEHFVAEGIYSGGDDQTWQEFLGPLLTREEAVHRLRLMDQTAFDELIPKGRILALPLSSGERAFPAFQFLPDGSVSPVIEPVIAIFQDIVATPYTIASWLRGPKDYLDGKSPMQWLELGGDSEPILAGARRAAAQLDQ